MPEIFKAGNTKDTKPQSVSPQVVMEESVNHSSALSSYIFRPTGITFETQETQETILLFLRQHPITNLGWLLGTFVLMLLPWVLTPIIVGIRLIPENMPKGYFVVIPLLWYLGTVGYAFTNFLHWYYNVYIVTDERVVDIDWISLMYKQISSAQLDKIQDVTYKQGGILDSFFDYGNVLIQTAGTDPNFEFESVPKPAKVVQQINHIIELKR